MLSEEATNINLVWPFSYSNPHSRQTITPRMWLCYFVDHSLFVVFLFAIIYRLSFELYGVWLSLVLRVIWCLIIRLESSFFCKCAYISLVRVWIHSTLTSSSVAHGWFRYVPLSPSPMGQIACKHSYSWIIHKSSHYNFKCDSTNQLVPFIMSLVKS